MKTITVWLGQPGTVLRDPETGDDLSDGPMELEPTLWVMNRLRDGSLSKTEPDVVQEAKGPAAPAPLVHKAAPVAAKKSDRSTDKGEVK